MVEEELEQMIRRRQVWRGRTALPSERELMAFFNVSRPHSVREALAALKRKGLVQINNGERPRLAPLR